MRVEWLLIGLSAMVSMGLGMIVFGQRQMWTKLSSDNVKVSLQLVQFKRTLQDRDFLRGLLQKQLELRRCTVEELKSELTERLQFDERQKDSIFKECLSDKVRKDNELAGLQKEQTEVEETRKKDSEAWTKELATLKEQKDQRSIICNYVKKDTAGVKLCESG